MYGATHDFRTVITVAQIVDPDLIFTCRDFFHVYPPFSMFAIVYQTYINTFIYNVYNDSMRAFMCVHNVIMFMPCHPGNPVLYPYMIYGMYAVISTQSRDFGAIYYGNYTEFA